jgi:hypothetical protein
VLLCTNSCGKDMLRDCRSLLPRHACNAWLPTTMSRIDANSRQTQQSMPTDVEIECGEAAHVSHAFHVHSEIRHKLHHVIWHASECKSECKAHGYRGKVCCVCDIASIATIQDSTSSRLLLGSSYSCFVVREQSTTMLRKGLPR